MYVDNPKMMLKTNIRCKCLVAGFYPRNQNFSPDPTVICQYLGWIIPAEIHQRPITCLVTIYTCLAMVCWYIYIYIHIHIYIERERESNNNDDNDIYIYRYSDNN